MNSSRIIRLLLAFAVLAAAGWFMRGYTTDDTYIHLRYAHNLIERGEFSFNPGASSYGATSPLWIFGLALLLKLGLGPFAAAWLLGVLCGAAVILVLDAILARMSCGPMWRGLLLVLVVSDPWFLRWTFSGMETPLATLALLVLLWPLFAGKTYDSRIPSRVLWPRYLAWGVAAGLCGLVRPEFMVLAPVALPWLLMFEYFRAGSVGGFSGRHWARPYKPVAAAVGGWLAVTLPWFLYAWSAFGRVTPGTASAKSAGLSFQPAVIAGSLWQSARTLGAGQGLLWVAVALLIGVVLFNHRRGGAPQESQDNEGEQERTLPGSGPWSVWGPVGLIGIVATWTVVLLGAYAVKQVWIISRYVSPLAPVILLALAVTAEWLLGGPQLTARTRRLGGVVIVAGAVLTMSLNAWIMADQVVPHARKFPVGLRECYLEMGKWLSENTPDGAVVAALDIGAVGYASDRPVLDLMGLVSPEILAVGQRVGFQEMVEQADWVTVAESTTGARASYYVDRAEGAPRWEGKTVHGVSFELLDTCFIEGLGLREPQRWTVALYRLDSTAN